MEPPNYQDVVVPSAPNLPPYFEKEPYNQEPPPAYGPENPAMPNQYQPYYSPYSAVPGQGPVQPPTHTVCIVPVEPPQAPDYLAYSIFTMLCCLPLGIGAVIYSVRTRLANRLGNITTAHQNSRVARNLAHCALGIGIILIKIIIICIVSSR